MCTRWSFPLYDLRSGLPDTFPGLRYELGGLLWDLTLSALGFEYINLREKDVTEVICSGIQGWINWVTNLGWKVWAKAHFRAFLSEEWRQSAVSVRVYDQVLNVYLGRGGVSWVIQHKSRIGVKCYLVQIIRYGVAFLSRERWYTWFQDLFRVESYRGPWWTSTGMKVHNGLARSVRVRLLCCCSITSDMSFLKLLRSLRDWYELTTVELRLPGSISRFEFVKSTCDCPM